MSDVCEYYAYILCLHECMDICILIRTNVCMCVFTYIVRFDHDVSWEYARTIRLHRCMYTHIHVCRYARYMYIYMHIPLDCIYARRGPKFGTYSDGGFKDFLLLINILHII